MISNGKVRVVLGVLVFCCVGVFVSGSLIWEPYAKKRKPRFVGVVGGVPFRISKWKTMRFLAATLIVPTVWLWSFWLVAPSLLLFLIAIAIFVLAGLSFYVLYATPWENTVVFLPDGLYISKDGIRFVVPWPEIVKSESGLFLITPSVFLNLRGGAASLQARIPASPGFQNRAENWVNANLTSCGFHVVLAGAEFGVDNDFLASAIKTYSTEPEKRRELAPAISKG